MDFIVYGVAKSQTELSDFDFPFHFISMYTKAKPTYKIYYFSALVNNFVSVISLLKQLLYKSRWLNVIIYHWSEDFCILSLDTKTAYEPLIHYTVS